MAELTLDRLGRRQIDLLRAVTAIAGRGRAPVLVGGAVRDAWLRRIRPERPVDLDVTVASGALAVARRLADRLGGAFVTLDAERGAARVVTLGRHIDLTDLRAPTLGADLRLRDYTVNALAVDLHRLIRRGRAPIVDPTGGLGDLRARRLRPPGVRAIAEDPLRALRGVRLEATHGLRLTSAAARLVRASAPALAAVSAERVRDEMLAILGLPEAARALRRVDRLGLLAAVLPEVEPMRLTPQPLPHRFDVLEHSLRAVAACDRLLARLDALRPFGEELRSHLAEPLGGGINRRQTLRLAALLHDVAKPETRRVVRGRVRFFEHDVIGAARVRAIGLRLRLPGGVTEVVARLVRQHLRPMHLAAAGEPTDRARYRFYRELGLEARDLLLLAVADAAAVRGESPLSAWARADLVRRLLGGWVAQQRAAAAPPLLRGEDVMDRFGLAPGPEVGRLLQRAREAQDLGIVSTPEEALAYLASPLAERSDVVE